MQPSCPSSDRVALLFLDRHVPCLPGGGGERTEVPAMAHGGSTPALGTADAPPPSERAGAPERRDPDPSAGPAAGPVGRDASTGRPADGVGERRSRRARPGAVVSLRGRASATPPPGDGRSPARTTAPAARGRRRNPGRSRATSHLLRRRHGSARTARPTVCRPAHAHLRRPGPASAGHGRAPGSRGARAPVTCTGTGATTGPGARGRPAGTGRGEHRAAASAVAGPGVRNSTLRMALARRVVYRVTRRRTPHFGRRRPRVTRPPQARPSTRPHPLRHPRRTAQAAPSAGLPAGRAAGRASPRCSRRVLPG